MNDMHMEKAVANLIEKLERHYYGKYRGFVVDNEDPEHLGRLKLTVPSVLGDVTTGWANPCLPYGGNMNQGFLFIPEKKTGVWVEFEEGDLEWPVWVGSFWSKPEGENELPKPNDPDGAQQEQEQAKVTRKIIKTLKGHTIQFEDKDGEESIIITQVTDKNKRNVIVMKSDGITILQKIEKDKSNTIEMYSNGIRMTDFSKNSIELNDSAFSIVSKVPFTLDAGGQSVEIIADTINMNKG